MVNLHGLAEKLKIDDMAVCGAEKFSEVEAILKKDMKLGILPPFTDLDIRKRVCPEETLAGAAGFIVILEHYTPETYKKRTGLYGNISPAASGEDYHRTVGKKLNRLVEELMAADPEGTYLAYVDNSPFSEKHVAIRAGLGAAHAQWPFLFKKVWFPVLYRPHSHGPESGIFRDGAEKGS